MKKPILGRQTFLPENTERLYAYEKFVKENSIRKIDENPLFTGRYFVILKDGNRNFEVIQNIFTNELGIKVAHSNDFRTESINEYTLQNADALIYDELGIALVGCQGEQIKILENANADFILAPEKVVYVPDEEPAPLNIASTWGIEITQAINSQFTGKGVKVAVLDTGFDANHPDFAGRNITTISFVPDETAEDVHGHGTHCIGSACGSLDINGQRYGVATESLIYSGKVLSNEGSGAQSWILNGITWAANNGCKVISMSLGSRGFPGQSYDLAYERAAQFAISKGAVLVAAAGNESRRSWNQFNAVGSPADCPSILAVAALDAGSEVADFSNRAINPTGLIDIAGPGVEIYSSWPMPLRYRTISGTSMATPHVAGIVALLCEQNPDASPEQIIELLISSAKKLPLLPIDVGAGLAIAP